MPWDSSAEYLTSGREGELVATILVNLDKTNHDQRRAADLIISDLIELGLCDAVKGPALYEHWTKSGQDYVPYEELAEHYR